MSTAGPRDARLNFRLPGELKDVIEEAAAVMGQSVSDYAIATLVTNARTVLRQSTTTALTARDRDRFIAALNDADARPNKGLATAARRFQKQSVRNGKR